MEEQTTIFITGATGFIGKHFLAHLLSTISERAKIYVLVRNDVVFSDPRVIALKGDLRDIKRHATEIREAQYVFHLGANVNFFGGGAEDERVNFESTKHLVDILKSDSRQLKNFIFISTIGAVDRHKKDTFSLPLTIESTPAPRTQYGKSKLKSEQWVKESGLPFTIIRPTWVYGTHMRSNSHINTFVSMVYKRSLLTRIQFPGRVSLIYVGDLVQSFISCIGNTKVIGKTYFGTTEALSIGAIFRIIGKEVTGTTPRQIPVPTCVSWFVKKFHYGIPLTVANLFVDYLYADRESYMHDFGITAPVSFEKGIRDVIATNTSLFKQVHKYTQIGFGFFGAWLKLSLYPVSFFKEVLPVGGTILDLGCGEGMLTNLLGQAIPGARMIGIDVDEKRIAQATSAASPNATFVCRRMEDVEVKDAEAVIVNDVLHHHGEEKQRELLKKVLETLRPGGIFVMKEVDANDMPDVWWTTFWDNLLYKKDTLHFRAPSDWDALLLELGAKRVQEHRVRHFWPASRTMRVYKKI